VRAKHLAHAARAEQGDDFIGADARSWGQRHMSNAKFDYMEVLVAQREVRLKPARDGDVR
jgi:hypothetical protein